MFKVYKLILSGEKELDLEFKIGSIVYSFFCVRYCFYIILKLNWIKNYIDLYKKRELIFVNIKVIYKCCNIF